MWLHFLRNVGIVVFMLSLVVMVYMFLCRSYKHFRGISEQEDAKFINAFVNRLYFVLITVSTIGYGDIAPVSLRARIITICVILALFVVILKAFDSIIDTYNKNLGSYVNKITDTLNPMTLLNLQQTQQEKHL